MAQVILDGKIYQVKDGTIQRRNINPRATRFETGLPGYASFTQGSAEVWKGLRGGIGHKYFTGSNTEECYWSEGVDATHHGAIILGPKVNTAGTGDDAFGKTVVKIINFEDGVYAIGDDLIAKWDAANSQWDSVETGISDPLDAIVATDSTDTYFFVSNASTAKRTTDGSSWTTQTGCQGYLAYCDNKLCSFYGQTMHYSPARDIDGTWDSCNAAGSDLGTAHGMFTARSQNSDEPMLCINASKGLFTFDFWVEQIYPYLKLTGHTNAGKASMFWNSYIWVSTLGGIKKIAGKLVTDVGPDQDDGLPSGYQGYISDMCAAGDGSWMVFSVNGGTSNKSSIFKMHGTTGGIQQIYTTSAANKPITALCYSPSSMTGMTNGRLWWGEGTDVKYCMMPDFNADVTEISTYEYVAASGKLVLPIFEPMPAINKTAIRIRANTKGCDANNKFTIYYRTNANTMTAVGSNWGTALGTLTSSPSPTALDFASGAGVEFKSIQFAIEVARHTTETVTPVLRSLEFDYDVATKRLRGWTFPVSVTQHNANEIVDNLHTSQDKDTMLLFYPSGSDATGQTSYRVKISAIEENIEWGLLRRNGVVRVTVGELNRG